MNVRILNKRDKEELSKWNEFALQKNYLYFHSHWSEIISSVYGFKPYYLYIEDSGNLQSVFPLFHVKFTFFKDELVSIPHLESGGMSNPDHYSLYFDFIGKKKITENIKIYQLNEPLEKFIANIEDVVLVKELPEKKEFIISSIKSATTRNYMRRVLEKDFKVIFENSRTALNEFYKVYLRRMREFGTPAHRFEYIEKIANLFKDETRILIVKKYDEIVGASFYIFFGEHLYNLYLVVPDMYLKEKVVYLIQYKAMEMGIENKMKKIILGRSTKNSGTFFYKTELGGIPVQLYLYNFRLTADGYNSIYKQSIKEKYSFASKIWSKLPPFITDRAGPFIRKWIY
ncbi:MAG: GNAT family N-acetyltransferase [Nitrospirae bacterium]|nr:GNAT family N-acetyltransferase [Nitrospirota bacterium]